MISNLTEIMGIGSKRAEELELAGVKTETREQTETKLVFYIKEK